MPEFALTIGIPGCGKTRWREKHGKHYFVVSPDEIRRELSGDIGDQSIHFETWRIALGRVQASLMLGHDTLLDATNTNTKERRWFLDRIPANCTRRAVVIHVDPDIAYQRICKDIRGKVDRSPVPEHRIYTLYGMFLHSLKVIGQEGYDQITQIK